MPEVPSPGKVLPPGKVLSLGEVPPPARPAAARDIWKLSVQRSAGMDELCGEGGGWSHYSLSVCIDWAMSFWQLIVCRHVILEVTNSGERLARSLAKALLKHQTNLVREFKFNIALLLYEAPINGWHCFLHLLKQCILVECTSLSSPACNGETAVPERTGSH